MSDFIKGLLGMIIITVVSIFLLDSCDNNNHTNLTFKTYKINICNEDIELYDFIDDEEFNSKQFEEYINEICIRNPEYDETGD